MKTITDPEVINIEIPGDVTLSHTRVMKLNQLISGDIEIVIDERNNEGYQGKPKQVFKFTVPSNRKQVLADYFSRA